MAANLSSASNDDLRRAADNARSEARWQDALNLYCQLDNAKTNSAVLLNCAICNYALGRHQLAFELAHQAMRLQESLWQAKLVFANAAKALGKKSEWVNAIQSLYLQQPGNPEVAMEYANVALNMFGNAELARQVIKPWLRHPAHGEAASTTQLMSLLYDRPKSMTAKALTGLIKTHARQYLQITALQRKQHASAIHWALQSMAKTDLPEYPAQGKKRIGFVSGLFCASPIYFLTVHAMRAIHANGHELVFFSRASKEDWATQELKQMATGWVDCSNVDAPALEAMLKAANLDELFDMAGWTDTEVLKALASKPAKAQLKWVGGQSCTTGLSCFDGFITDKYQTPPETFELYTEPLISLGDHYVQYTPPPYMPKPRERAEVLNLRKIQQRGHGTLGVVANPVKLSGDFLKMVQELLHNTPDTVEIKFVDNRYLYRPTRNRIANALGEKVLHRVKFLTPTGHAAFLNVINELDLILDTFPYSGGLTLCEALHLKVPVHAFRHDRKLFCERHVNSHLQIN